MRALCVLPVLICVAALGAWQTWAADEKPAASPRATTSRPPVKRLSSFEPEEMVRLGGKRCKLESSDNLFKSKPPIAGVVVSSGSDAPPYRLTKAHSTDGQYCIVSRAYGCPPARTERLGVLNFYAKLFGMNRVKDFLKAGDWSGYDYLWLDVTAPYSDSMPWLFFEDSRTFGPYVRFKVSKGQTVTLSVPLAAAARVNLTTRRQRGHEQDAR